MILFNCTRVNIDKIVDDNIINVRRADVAIRNKMLEDIDLLVSIKDILEGFMYQEDRILITLYGLDEALENNKEHEFSSRNYNSFVALINAFIGSGHEIVFFVDKYMVDPDVKEICDSIEGTVMINDQIRLIEYCRNHIM